MEQLSPLRDWDSRTSGDRVGMDCSEAGTGSRNTLFCSSTAPLKPKSGLNGPPAILSNIIGTSLFEGSWLHLSTQSTIKRKNFFEFENTPYLCLEAVVNTPTARGGQTLVRLKMRNLLTNAVFEKSFKANDKFKEPDLQSVPASYLYSDSDGSHFLDQENIRNPDSF